MQVTDSSITTTADELDDLFVEALEITPQARRAWLTDRCAGNQTLIDEVLSLTAAHEQSGEFLIGSASTTLPTDKQQTDYSGKRFGPWELQSIIGRGGMGQVYLAQRCDGTYDQKVAVKVGAVVGLQSVLFKRERQTLANLNHPVITKILDAGDIPDSNDAYLVMEYIDGQNIIDFVRSNPQLSETQRAALIESILEALYLAHCQGIIHCDIKPDNILVDRDGKAKLLDFGISRSTDDEAETDESVQVRGLTPAYASPQRLAGFTPTIGDDIYGVGLLFGLIMSHKEPEQAQHIQEKPANKRVDEIAHLLEPEIRAIYKAATATEPKHRYTSAHEFAEDLNNWRNNQPVGAYKGGPLYRLKKALARHRFMSTSAILLSGVMLISLFAWKIHNDKQQLEQTQREQINAALQLSKNISEGLDFRMEQLPGSLLVRISAAESAIQQIEQIHEQQPESAEIKAALAQAHLKLQTFYFQPTQLHIGEFEKGRKGLSRAYTLAYEAYHLDKSENNFNLLARAQRRITEQLMATERDWETTIRYEEDLVNEFKTLNVKDTFTKAFHRWQLNVLFRINLTKGDYDEARALLNKAKPVKPDPKVELTDFMKSRYESVASRHMELNAHFAFVVGDYDTAREQFNNIATEFREKKPWKDKRRAMYAYRALACMDLDQDIPVYTAAVQHLNEARSLARKIADTHPNALSTKWEYQDLSPIEAFEVQANQPMPDGRMADHDHWFGTFGCNDPSYMTMPAPPEGGWKTLVDSSSIDLRDVLKPLR